MQEYNPLDVSADTTTPPGPMVITQVLAEFYGCVTPALHDAAALTAAAHAAVTSAGATVVGQAEARYVPHGLTVALFLAESHMVLTTWPEHRLLMVDVLLCNPDMDCYGVLKQLRRTVCPYGTLVTQEIRRAIGHAPA